MSTLQDSSNLEYAQPLPHDRAPFTNIWTEQPVPQKPKMSESMLDSAYWRKLNKAVPEDRATKGLEEAYVIEGRPAVDSFIKNNRLRGLLLQAINPLDRAFGKAAIKSLMLACDDEGAQTLYCLITISSDLHSARRALAVFDHEWWLKYCGLAAGQLNFDFELV